MNNEKTGDYIFYIILTILISMLVLNIIEKHLYENAEKDKKMNPFYKDKLFLNIKTGKIVLFILLLAVFILLVNPFKVVGSMLNPNIFSIFVDQRHEDLINNVKENIGFTNSEVVDLNKPPYKKIVNELDKTFSELILGKSNDAILNRIIEDNDNSEENVLNVLYTFSKINNFNKFSDEPDNLKFALNKELFRSCVTEGTSLSKESFYGKFLANITTNDEMSTYQRFYKYLNIEWNQDKDIELNDDNLLLNNLIPNNSDNFNSNKFIEYKLGSLNIKNTNEISSTFEELKQKLTTYDTATIPPTPIANAEITPEIQGALSKYTELFNKIKHWEEDDDYDIKLSTEDNIKNLINKEILGIFKKCNAAADAKALADDHIKNIKQLIDLAEYANTQPGGFLIKGLIDTKIGITYRKFNKFDACPAPAAVNTIDFSEEELKELKNEYYENYIKNILTNDYTKSLISPSDDALKNKIDKLKDITIDEDFLYNYKALKGYISEDKISKIDKIIRKYTRLQRYKNSSCLTRPLFTPDKDNLRNVDNIIALLMITFGVDFITSCFVLDRDVKYIEEGENDKNKPYKKISKDYKIFAPKNNTFLNINFILYNVVIFTLLFIVTNTNKYWEERGFGNEYNKYLLMTIFLVKVGAQSIFRFNKYVTEDLLLSIRVIELCCSAILFGGTGYLMTKSKSFPFKHFFKKYGIEEEGPQLGAYIVLCLLIFSFIIYNNTNINHVDNTFKYSKIKTERQWFNEIVTSYIYGIVLILGSFIIMCIRLYLYYNDENLARGAGAGGAGGAGAGPAAAGASESWASWLENIEQKIWSGLYSYEFIYIVLGITITVLTAEFNQKHGKKDSDPDAKPVILNILMIVSGIIIAVNARDASGDQNGGGKNTNLYKIVGGILATGIVIYLYKNYEDNKLNKINKINKKKKIKGGVTAKEIETSASIDIATKDVFEIKPADQANSNILIIVIGIILLIILWSSGILDGDDLKDYISNQLLSQKNLYNLRLLFFPFTILIFISLLFGTPFLETVLKGFVEKQSIGNFYDDKEKNETIKTNIEKQQDIDKTANKPDKGLFRGIKYSAIAFIIIYYIILLATHKLEFSFSIIVNLVIIGIFVYLLIHASYILLKIYLNENINKIGEKIDAIQKMKSQIQFKQGKIDPKLDNVVEIDDDKIKRDYEVFINKLYDDIKNLLQINNIYLTTAIENYIKIKLIKHKPIEEQFKLSHTELQKTLSVTPAKKIINGGTVVPIAETDISKKLNGKWYNNANDNNVLIYVYKTVGIIIYLNKNDYINMKLTEIQNEGTQYKFVNEGKLLLTYDNEKVIIDSINYAKLSNDFSTENIIRKTLTENDVFKNINYMITIDKDAKYIGKYNLVDNITKYNHYSKSGNVLKTDLENIIINKILLIKAIKEKQYMSANELNKQVNKLEKKFKKKEEFNKYDTDKSGTIDANEIQSYVNKNHKLSGAGNVKIKSAIFDGSDVIITFDKKITNKITPNPSGSITYHGFVLKSDFGDTATILTLNLDNHFKLRINNTDKTNSWKNTIIDGTDNIMIDEKTLKLKVKSDILNEVIGSNDIKINIVATLYIESDEDAGPPIKPKIQRTLKKSIINVYKQISNFEEFDASIFGT